MMASANRTAVIFQHGWFAPSMRAVGTVATAFSSVAPRQGQPAPLLTRISPLRRPTVRNPRCLRGCSPRSRCKRGWRRARRIRAPTDAGPRVHRSSSSTRRTDCHSFHRPRGMAAQLPRPQRQQRQYRGLLAGPTLAGPRLAEGCGLESPEPCSMPLPIFSCHRWEGSLEVRR